MALIEEEGPRGYDRAVLKSGLKSLALIGLAVAGLSLPGTSAGAGELEAAFDRSFSARTELPHYGDPLQAEIASLANANLGRIGVAAMDLSTGRMVSVLGDQPFPMASTSKIAIVATFLEGVDQGRYSLNDTYPLMIPVPSAKFSSPEAPVRAGPRVSAARLIDLTLTRSDNQATDALIAAVGGLGAVNDWIARAGLSGMRIDRTIATLVRDDGAIDPAKNLDLRDSTTPHAMIALLSGIYQGRWLSASSRKFLLDTMANCVTGKRRIPALLPAEARVAHKTGTLHNTASDVGILHTPDGRAIAVAIYVTGQGGKPKRDERIAWIARSVYQGYESQPYGARLSAAR
jgi:beta-lactamase class A